MWWRRLRWVLALLALSTLATCPVALRRCRTERKTEEARAMLDYLVARVGLYYKAHGTLPVDPAGPTPTPAACCDDGGACAADTTRWNLPAWRALGFTVDGPHRYSYSYELRDGGKRAVVRATGDLDCNGTYGVYEAQLVPAPGATKDLIATWTSTNPNE